MNKPVMSPRALLDQSQRGLDRQRYMIKHGALAALLGSMAGAWHTALEPGAAPPTRREIEGLRRSLEALFEADLANVRDGIYPRALLHRFPTRRYLKQVVPEGLVEMGRIFARRRRGACQDLPEGEDLSAYPAYYARNFHWQTDGWLSDRSARYYDLSVEFLFGGTADIMRRMGIRPVVEGIAGVSRPRVLDLACGTGRFLAQLHEAVPRARLYGLDLSPHYIRHARRALERVDVGWLTENAEAVPLDTGSMDCVTSVFLFHELPRDVRRRVMAEALRVVRPGGRFVIVDSAQLDAEGLAPFLERFPVLYHEPYYKSYLRDDLGAALAEVGFEGIESRTHFVSKVVVGVKPQAR